MPLPDTATGLDWTHLVDAARAFEGKDTRPLGLGMAGQGIRLGQPLEALHIFPEGTEE